MLINPKWQSIVPSDDREYISAILNDWKSRISLDPEALFVQACSLSVGPIITALTGSDLATHPALAATAQSFVVWATA